MSLVCHSRWHECCGWKGVGEEEEVMRVFGLRDSFPNDPDRAFIRL